MKLPKNSLMDDSVPFFSIIVPTYNSFSTIEICILSIINQTFTDYEICIVDGESTDNTIETVNSLCNSKIKIVSEKDKGIYDAMNKGIKFGKGKWFLFLGSDDELKDPEVLKDIHSLIITKSCKVVYGSVEVNGSTGWALDKQIYDGKFEINKLLRYNIAHQAIFYHKEVFETCGNYNLDYRICADYDFNLRVYARYPFYYFDRIISIFKAGGTSTNVADSAFNKDMASNIINYYRKVIYKKPFQRFEIQIIQKAKEQFAKFHFFSGAYLYFIGLMFKVRRKFS